MHLASRPNLEDTTPDKPLLCGYACPLLSCLRVYLAVDISLSLMEGDACMCASDSDRLSYDCPSSFHGDVRVKEPGFISNAS